MVEPFQNMVYPWYYLVGQDVVPNPRVGLGLGLGFNHVVNHG